MVKETKRITFTNNSYKYDLYLDWSIEDRLNVSLRIPEYDLAEPLYDVEINLETGKAIDLTQYRD
jgi:hypothetical protein